MSQRYPGIAWVGTRRQYDPGVKTSEGDQVMLGRIEAYVKPLEQLVARLAADEIDRDDPVARDVASRLTNLAGVISTRMRA